MINHEIVFAYCEIILARNVTHTVLADGYSSIISVTNIKILVYLYMHFSIIDCCSDSIDLYLTETIIRLLAKRRTSLFSASAAWSQLELD